MAASSHRTASRLARALVVSLVVVLAGGGVALQAVAAQADDDEPGTVISVEVSDDEATPTPTATPHTTGPPATTPASHGGGAGAGHGSNGNGDSAGTGGPPATSPSPAPGEISVGGVLYVGGLNVSTSPMLDPLDGVVDLRLTVRNASKTPFDSTVRFWMTSAFGTELDRVTDVEVIELAPGEVRTVTARLQHAGQWTLVNAHATITPPKEIEGTRLHPATRDRSALVFPWLLAVLAVAAAATLSIVRSLRGPAMRMLGAPA